MRCWKRLQWSTSLQELTSTPSPPQVVQEAQPAGRHTRPEHQAVMKLIPELQAILDFDGIQSTKQIWILFASCILASKPSTPDIPAHSGKAGVEHTTTHATGMAAQSGDARMEHTITHGEGPGWMDTKRLDGYQALAKEIVMVPCRKPSTWYVTNLLTAQACHPASSVNGTAMSHAH